MKNKVLVVLTFLSIFTIGCRFWGIRGSGDRDYEIRNIDEFTELEVSGAFDVRVTVGETPKLEISGDDNLLKYVVTKVRGDKLIIETRKDLRQREQIRIIVSTYELESLDASGANDIKVRNIDCSRFYLGVSGACNIELEGKTNALRADMSGATSLEAGRLTAEEVRIECSGASNAEVYASEYLNAEASGVSNIKFWGDPDDTDVHASGVSSISRR